MRLLVFHLTFIIIRKQNCIHMIFVCLNVCLDASFGTATVWHYEALLAALLRTAHCTVVDFDEFHP